MNWLTIVFQSPVDRVSYAQGFFGGLSLVFAVGHSLGAVGGIALLALLPVGWFGRTPRGWPQAARA